MHLVVNTMVMYGIVMAVKRKITITGYDNGDPRRSLASWNKQVMRPQNSLYRG
jgi:hypothetical protein